MSDQYAIVQAGGRQLKLAVGQTVTVDRQAAEPGAELSFDQVLVARDGAQVRVGRPWIDGARVVCAVRGHRRGKKLTIVKFRRREGYHRTIGHRSDLTDLVVKEIRTGA